MPDRRAKGLLILLFLIAGFACVQYFAYASQVAAFPYDWEPTDGDHLNIVSRILQGREIYSDWKQGTILNIYNPGYHYITALFSLETGPSMTVARTLSVIAMAGCAFLVFFAVATAPLIRRRIATTAGAFCGLAVFLLWNTLTDLTHINPNALLAFFGLASLMTLDLYDRRGHLLPLLLSAVFAYAAVFTKQQGVVAAGTGIALLLLRRRKGPLALYSLTLGLLSLATIAYLELTNSQNFLNSTFFYLRQIMPSNLGKALYRLAVFALYEHPWVLLTAFAVRHTRQTSRTWDTWQISLPFHIGILLLTLGNMGGGPNYLFPLWLTLVVISGRFVSEAWQTWITDGKAHPIAGLNPRWLQPALLWMVVAFGVSAAFNFKEYRFFLGRMAQLPPLMQEYYDTVAKLMSRHPDQEVFAARTVGAFVAAGAEIPNEYCTFGTYAWPAGRTALNKNVIIEQIRNHRFSVITSGAQAFPEDLLEVIRAHYKLDRITIFNYWMGTLGPVEIYVPKTENTRAETDQETL